MESILFYIFLLVLLFIVYYWSLYYFENNKYIKKTYIPLNDKKKSNIETFDVGGQDKDSHCKPNPCQHGGKCEEDDDYDYTCVCVSGFSGRNCDFEDETAEGVRVELLENIDDIIPLAEFNRVALFNTEDIQWNDYL